jgi:hypothetical protein
MATKARSLAPARKPIAQNIKPRDRGREMQWIRENRLKRAGQWVALEGDRVLASGSDAREVYHLALKAGASPPFLVHLDPSELLPAIGGW